MAGNGIRSARGQIVDFDLLKIKEQIASAPKTVTVQARETFIDNKYKRQIKRQIREATTLATENTPSIDEAVIEDVTINDEIITDNPKVK